MTKVKPPSIIFKALIIIYIEGLHQAHDAVFLAGFFDQVGQDFAVCVCLEEDALFLQIGRQLAGIHQIAFPGHRKVSALMAEKKGFHIVETALGSVGILDTAYTQGSRKGFVFPVGEHFAQKALPPVGMGDTLFVKGNDARAFLAAVLKVVKAVVNEGRCVLDAVNCQYSH